jgi:ectoine hydroxylase-related dioxygenase (phytanoyl-CoA dioxygenase family)|tara:strand:- start:72 stop:866 length:795 start_codon:yes stop_codon:yes gene_type:complete
MFSEEQKKSYKELGYVIFRKAINPNILDDLFKTTISLLNNYTTIDDINFRSFSDHSFHNAMLKIRKEEPEKFSSIYRAIQKSCSINNLTTNINIVKYAASILRDVPHNLSNTISVLRMDPPNDLKNHFGFHQDSAYLDYPEAVKDINGDNNVTLWMPLLDIDKKKGAIKLCEKSHLENLAHTHNVLPTSNPISLDIINKFNIYDAEVNLGDVILFHGNMMHSSGINSSSFFRFSFVTRYYRMGEKDFYLHPESGDKIKGLNGFN